MILSTVWSSGCSREKGALVWRLYLAGDSQDSRILLAILFGLYRCQFTVLEVVSAHCSRVIQLSRKGSCRWRLFLWYDNRLLINERQMILLYDAQRSQHLRPWRRFSLVIHRWCSMISRSQTFNRNKIFAIIAAVVCSINYLRIIHCKILDIYNFLLPFALAIYHQKLLILIRLRSDLLLLNLLNSHRCIIAFIFLRISNLVLIILSPHLRWICFI